MVCDTTAPKNAVRFRDALLFAKYSYDSVAKGKNQGKLDALCDRLAQRAAFSLKMEALSPRQMECVRKALLATAAIDGFDAHRKLSPAKWEACILAGMAAAISLLAGFASGSPAMAVAVLGFGMPYFVVRAIADPQFRVISGIVEINGLQDRIWSAISSGAAEGRKQPRLAAALEG